MARPKPIAETKGEGKLSAAPEVKYGELTRSRKLDEALRLLRVCAHLLQELRWGGTAELPKPARVTTKARVKEFFKERHPDGILPAGEVSAEAGTMQRRWQKKFHEPPPPVGTIRRYLSEIKKVG